MSDRWLMAIQDTFYFRRRQSAASALSRPRFFATSVGFTNVYLPKPKVNPDPELAGGRAAGRVAPPGPTIPAPTMPPNQPAQGDGRTDLLLAASSFTRS